MNDLRVHGRSSVGRLARRLRVRCAAIPLRLVGVLLVCGCADSCGDFDCCGQEACSFELEGHGRCLGDGTIETCRDASECSWFCSGPIWCPAEECGLPDELASSSGGAPRAWDCVEDTGLGAVCRERDAVRCDDPGTWGCDGTATTYCLDDGCLAHVVDCTVDTPWPDWNGTCVIGDAGVAICGFDGSGSCDPATFGPDGTGCLCEGSRFICCDPEAEMTFISAVCPASQVCTTLSRLYPCFPRSDGADGGADAAADLDDDVIDGLSDLPEA